MNNPTHKPTDYKGILLWGRLLASYSAYIMGQQELAAQENAPIDAIYKDCSTGEWRCVSHLKPDHHFVAEYNDFIKEGK